MIPPGRRSIGVGSPRPNQAPMCSELVSTDQTRSIGAAMTISREMLSGVMAISSVEGMVTCNHRFAYHADERKPSLAHPWAEGQTTSSPRPICGTFVVFLNFLASLNCGNGHVLRPGNTPSMSPDSLIGRAEECAVLDRLVEEVTAGRSR